VTDRAERGAWVLAEYAGRYYPGAEDVEDADGAYTVAGDIVADLLHALDSLGHPNPEGVLDLATAHYVEERANHEHSMSINPATNLDYCKACGYTVTS
jgi:hypothetical protein